MNGRSQALINLMRGWPSTALLPVAQTKAASEAALSSPDIATSSSGLLYGPDAGYQPLREQVAAWLTAFYQPSSAISPERICVTGGASQNLACLLQVFSDPIYTRNVWMVSPTYYLACRIFEDSGFSGKLRSVPEDEDGIDIEFLESEISKSERKAVAEGNNNQVKLKPPRPWSKLYRNLIYAVPTFANPSSRTMSLGRRHQLVRLARRYDALIIADDVYDQLQWSASPRPSESSLERALLPRIVDIDRKIDGGAEREGADGFGNAVSNGSFSKIVGPGCRTGWAEGSEKLAWGLSQVGSSRSGGAPSHLTATLMFKLLESGDLHRHIFHTLQPAYAKRYRITILSIQKHLVPLGVRLPQPGREVVGGYFIWFSLPAPLLADEVATRAQEEEGLIIGQGPLFGVYGDESRVNLEREVRVCFSWEDEEQLAEGIERLGRVIHGMLEERPGARMAPSGAGAIVGQL
ncbi:hypothetical protein MMC20_000395 [Loxospora ochrophaea]|nr:hypothetical protein [Loxospora ochrophaea]